MNTARWISLVSTLAFVACGGGESTTTTTNNEQTQTTAGGEHHATAESSSNMAASTAPVASPAPVAAATTVIAGTSTPIPDGLHPRVQIAAPRDRSLSRTNRVEVRLRVTDWPAPQDMRHIHLIVDNEPYRRIDDPSRPIVLENLSEGTHVLRAFPGWHTHESVKTPGAFAVVRFQVGNNTDTLHVDPAAPHLSYSRPKGDYNGAEAEHILLDFYLSNIPNNNALAADGVRVHYAIDGATSGDITSWVPHYIDNLPDGEHHVVLDLIGANGQPAPGPFNHIDRVIHVNRSAPPPAPASPAPGASASPAPAAHTH